MTTPVVRLALGLVLLGLTWALIMPPGANFDERAHLIKAVGVAGGQLAGDPFVPTAAERSAFARPGPTARRERGGSGPVRAEALRWQARTQRRFELPPGVLKTSYGCTASSTAASGACTEGGSDQRGGTGVSYAGTYQPLTYAPAGLAARAAGSPHGAVVLARLATAVLSLGLLVAAAAALWDPRAGPLSLLGGLVAFTPMTVYCASTLSPSGPEIAAAVCFAACLIRLARREPAPRWVWAATAASGGLLALARALGPAFVVLALLAVWAAAGRGRAVATLRNGGRWAAGAALAVVVAAGAGLGWEFAVQPRPSPSGSSLVSAIVPSLEHLHVVAHHAVGVFGGYDTAVPPPALLLWALMTAVLLITAVAVGDRRERIVIAVLVVGAVVVVLVMSLVYREIGPLHGRYALPALVVVPLLAGEIVRRRRDRLSAGWGRQLLAAVAVAAALVHAVALAVSGRRFAVGADGPLLFVASPEWAPPGGWLPWLFTGGLGCVLIATTAFGQRTPRTADRL